MNSVERVKAICKERKIPISKLESDLRFSNGYIGQLRKGVFPADRLAKIASYLGVRLPSPPPNPHLLNYQGRRIFLVLSMVLCIFFTNIISCNTIQIRT